jgi:hypothetical protein
VDLGPRQPAFAKRSHFLSLVKGGSPTLYSRLEAESCLLGAFSRALFALSGFASGPSREVKGFERLPRSGCSGGRARGYLSAAAIGISDRRPSPSKISDARPPGPEE